MIKVAAGSDLPPLFFYVVIVLVGLVFGSFISVLVARIPHQQKLSGRSTCLSCGVQISNIDNVPIFGYVRLKGKCRSCNQPISIRYLLLEIGSAISVFIPFLKFDRWTLILAWELLVVLGLALAAIDLELHRLPDVLTGSLYLGGLVLLSIDALVHHHTHELHNAFIASIVLSAFYWAVNQFSKGGMGMGDVKLASSIGLYTGYESITHVYVASMIGFALGSSIAALLILAKRASRKTHIPFGPFMILGVVLSLWVTPWISRARGIA